MADRPAVDADLVPRRSLDNRVRRFRGMFLVSNGEHAFELDEVASFIFGHVDGIASVRQIARLLAERYGISLDEATADTAEFLQQLAEGGVLVVDGGE